MKVRMKPNMGHVIYVAEVIRLRAHDKYYDLKILQCDERPGLIGATIKQHESFFDILHDSIAVSIFFD